MAQDTASEAACWVHIDKDSERLVFTRGAEPHDSISCPVAWVPMILDLVQRDARGVFERWVPNVLVPGPRPAIERGMILFPIFCHPVGGVLPAAHRAGAKIEDVLDTIETLAPAALTQWMENNPRFADREEEAWRYRELCR